MCSAFKWGKAKAKKILEHLKIITTTEDGKEKEINGKDREGGPERDAKWKVLNGRRDK